MLCVLSSETHFFHHTQGSLISDFDRSFTIRVFGYPTLADYYKDASNKNRLHLVKKPLICLQAEDDPFAPQKSNESFYWLLY